MSCLPAQWEIVQALDVVLDAARLCLDRMPRARFILVGGGVDRDRLQARAEAEGLANVVFIPPQHPSAMGRIYGLAHVLLVHLKDDPLFRITIPSKTQACMAAGTSRPHGRCGAMRPTWSKGRVVG